MRLGADVEGERTTMEIAGWFVSFRQASSADSAQGMDVCEVKTSLSFDQKGSLGRKEVFGVLFLERRSFKRSFMTELAKRWPVVVLVAGSSCGSRQLLARSYVITFPAAQIPG